MSLAIHADDHGGFRLYRGSEQAGWIEGRAVALLGFRSADRARRAAGAAYDALRNWVARQRRTDVPPMRTRALRTQLDNGRMTLMLDGVAVGRIVGPGESLSRSPTWGFELHLPPGFGPVAGISAAQVIDHALARRAAARRLERVGAGV